VNAENEAPAVNNSVGRSPGGNAEPHLLDGVAYASKVFVAVWLCWGPLGVVGVRTVDVLG